MNDLKTKIENREADIQRAYDNARLRMIKLIHIQEETTKKIEDEHRIINICKRRARELGVSNIL